MVFSKVLGQVTAVALSVCVVTSGATLALAISAEPAFANNGNGNGNGRSNSNRGNSSQNDNSNGRSNTAGKSSTAGSNGNSSSTRSANGYAGAALSSELGSLNAAHASPAALANAAPGSMPGKLRDYRDTFRGLLSAVAQQNLAYDEFLRLSEMSDAQIAAAYPNGGHDQALANATSTYSALRHNAATAQAQNQATLQRLTEGRALSTAAMEDLHVLLGL